MRHEKIVHTIKNCGKTVTLRISPVSTECGHSGQTSITSYESSDQGSSHRSSSTSYQKSDAVSSTDVDFDVTLIRASKGFGFSIRGGQDFNKMPLYVLRIADDGPAKQDGRLKVCSYYECVRMDINVLGRCLLDLCPIPVDEVF